MGLIRWQTLGLFKTAVRKLRNPLIAVGIVDSDSYGLLTYVTDGEHELGALEAELDSAEEGV